MILDQDFPPDIRVEKEARALLAAGHQVIVMCVPSEGKPLAETWEGIKIVRLPRLPGILQRLSRWSQHFLMRSWQWEQHLDRVIRTERLEVLHVHDLPMVGSALQVAGRQGLPVVADLHENYAAMVEMFFREGQGNLFFRLVAPPWRWNFQEKRWLKKTAQVIVVVDEARERLVQAGLSVEKITVIENTEDESYFSAFPLDQELIAQFQADFVIAYVGGIEGPHRGLLTAVEAMPTILASIPNARLLIVGAGSLKPMLEAMIAKLHLASRVTLTGHQPFQKVPTYIALSAVCLVPHLANPHTEATIPHKLFQYMLMGKPVVVSSCRPLQRIVEATGSGLVFQAGDGASLANAVIRLKDSDLRQKLGEAGRQAAMGHYSWRETAHKLTALYEHLD